MAINYALAQSLRCGGSGFGEIQTDGTIRKHGHQSAKHGGSGQNMPQLSFSLTFSIPALMVFLRASTPVNPRPDC